MGLQGTQTGSARYAASVLLRSHDLGYSSLQLSKVLILPTLTTTFPIKKITTTWSHIAGLPLADPGFARCAPVDMILGADIYGTILRGGIIQGPPGTPAAQLTALGWVLMGPIAGSDSTARVVTTLHSVTLADLSKQVHKFWEQNEITSAHIPTPDDEYCEEVFQTSHVRDLSGRYTVRLPIKQNSLQQLGDSRSLAVQQFNSLERRLHKSLELKQKYSNFMLDYCSQGHMVELTLDERIQASRSNSKDLMNCSSTEFKQSYYLPHHGVINHWRTQRGARAIS